MRLIPGKTKVKIELFRGITIGDIAVGAMTLLLALLVLLSTFPGRFYMSQIYDCKFIHDWRIDYGFYG